MNLYSCILWNLYIFPDSDLSRKSSSDDELPEVPPKYQSKCVQLH